MHVVTVDSCATTFQASMEIDAWVDADVNCHSGDLYTFIKKPLFFAAE